MTLKHEVRFAAAPVQVREEEDTGVIKVVGYAAVFEEKTDIGGYFTEVISRGAFTDAIKRDDVVFLVNHEGLPLARTRSGTLKLSQDDKGLRIESELDLSDPDVQKIVPKMKRGDLDKMSFAFVPEIEIWDETESPPLRTIDKARLYDVSIVTNPAYGGTEIGLRSLQAHRLATVSKPDRARALQARDIQREAKANLARVSQ